MQDTDMFVMLSGCCDKRPEKVAQGRKPGSILAHGLKAGKVWWWESLRLFQTSHP